MIRLWMCLLLSLSLVVLAPAPSAFAAGSGKHSELAMSGPRKHISTIVLSGVAGAILGLSTLSFYGRPQEKLAYIPMGAAIGIITGALFTTYKAATEPRDFYSSLPPPSASSAQLFSQGPIEAPHRFDQPISGTGLAFNFSF